MRTSLRASISLVPGVETEFKVDTLSAIETPRSGPIDVVRLGFATVVLSGLLSDLNLRMQLSLSMDRETLPNRPGPLPIPSSIVNAPRGAFANLIHFVHDGNRGADIVNLYGYEFNPNDGEIIYERHPLVNGQPIGSSRCVGVHVTKRKYPDNHEKAGTYIDFANVDVKTSIDMLPQDPRGDGLEIYKFARNLAYGIKKDVLDLANPDRYAVAVADDFPNVFEDSTLREAFATRQAR